MPDRRKHSRIDTLITVSVRRNGKSLETQLENISEGGMRFKTYTRYDVGVELTLELFHKAVRYSKSLTVRAEVVRVVPITRGYETRYEIAVEFLNLSEEARAEIKIMANEVGGVSLQCQQ